ncbi:MAG TPA: hypothetical protein VFR32_04160 [Gaiellaceae bacterium]|nr:hypothetical protein [Gaiellaceae bacterium]
MTTLGAHVSRHAWLLAVVAIALACIFLRALTESYAFTDDYAILFVADGMGSSLWFGDSVIGTVSASGRPLAGLLDEIAFSAAGTIDNLRYVRLVGIAGIVALAVVLHWALVRSRIAPAPAALIAVLMCSLPPFLVYGSWAVLFNAPYAALLGGGASLLAVAGLEGPRGLLVDRLIGSTALLLAALLVYQPAAMFFWVFLAVALVGTVPHLSRAYRVTWAHAAIAGVALSLAFVVRQLAVHLQERAPNADDDVFTSDVAGKLSWFVREPLYWSLNLFEVKPSPWLAAFVAAVATVGIVLGLRHHRARTVPYVAIAIALVPLSLLPNLVVTGTTPTYRMMGSLSALVALYFCLGALGLWLALRAWLRPRVNDRSFLQLERLGLVASVGFVAAAVVFAARNVTNLIVEPQRAELRTIRSQVAALPAGTTKIGFVVIEWYHGFTRRYISDEFIPSSSKPWTAEPAVLLVLREQGRLPSGGSQPVVDQLPVDTTAFPTREPLIDMRTLGAQQR